MKYRILLQQWPLEWLVMLQKASYYCALNCCIFTLQCFFVFCDCSIICTLFIFIFILRILSLMHESYNCPCVWVFSGIYFYVMCDIYFTFYNVNFLLLKVLNLYFGNCILRIFIVCVWEHLSSWIESLVNVYFIIYYYCSMFFLTFQIVMCLLLFESRYI